MSSAPKVMRSDNLKRHAKSYCMKNYHAATRTSSILRRNEISRTKEINIATLDEIKSGSGKFDIVDHQQEI